MAESQNTTDDEFAGIPNMPSDDELKSDILRTAGPEYWRPFSNEPRREPTRFLEISEKAAAKVLEARLTAGPGPTGNAYQWELFDQHQRMEELQSERARLSEKLAAIGFIDPATKKETPLITDPKERERLEIALGQTEARIIRLEGKGGRAKLERALKKAMRARKIAHKEAFVTSEAKRRAAAEAREAEIERRKGGFRKFDGNQ